MRNPFDAVRGYIHAGRRFRHDARSFLKHCLYPEHFKRVEHDIVTPLEQWPRFVPNIFFVRCSKSNVIQNALSAADHVEESAVDHAGDGKSALILVFTGDEPVSALPGDYSRICEEADLLKLSRPERREPANFYGMRLCADAVARQFTEAAQPIMVAVAGRDDLACFMAAPRAMLRHGNIKTNSTENFASVGMIGGASELPSMVTALRRAQRIAPQEFGLRNAQQQYEGSIMTVAPVWMPERAVSPHGWMTDVRTHLDLIDAHESVCRPTPESAAGVLEGTRVPWNKYFIQREHNRAAAEARRQNLQAAMPRL